ncbi:MAG: hypothetical protein SOX25_05560 [Eubacteriales bacterium]|nr:hypothetical protein [Eubacteriales bacterium]
MDNFLEEVVVKRKRGLQGLSKAVAWIVLVILGLYAFLQLQNVMYCITAEGFTLNTLIYALQLIVFGGLAVLIFLNKDKLNTEYEYTFTNGQMDFAQVYNNRKRKSLGTMNVRNVEACGMVSSGSFQRYINMPNVKRTNWFLNREAELFYFYFQKENQKRIIIIEPSEEMVGLIKKYVPQGVWQIN